jgi:hypothetical protein
MITLENKPYSKQKSVLHLFSLIFLLMILSCTKEQNITMGTGFISKESGIIRIDTFRLNFSSMLFDSLPSSGEGTALCGGYSDPVFGKLSLKSYMPFTYPESYIVGETAVYDSTFLILSYNKYFYGDTSLPFKVEVFRLTEDIDPGDNDYLYNNQAFEYDPEPIGEFGFEPHPSGNDSIAVRLNDLTGKVFFEDLRHRTKYGSGEEDITDYFKGIMLNSEYENPGTVLGFSVTAKTPKIRIYYHITGENTSREEVEFPVSDVDLQYNQVITDRSGTCLEKLSIQKNDLPADSSEGFAFMQCGKGIMVKIAFPSMDQLLLMENEGVFLSAFLDIKPVNAAYRNKVLPDSLELYYTDSNNRFGTQLTNLGGNKVYGILNADYQFNEDTYYRFDLSAYFRKELSDKVIDPGSALLLTFTSGDVYAKVDNLYFGTDPDSEFAPKLSVYFMHY